MKQIKRQILLAMAFTLCGVILFSVGVQAATFTVTTTADSGAGSLRAAVAAANATTENDTINFAIPAGDAGCTAGGVCTITLMSGELNIRSVSSAGSLMITNATGASNLLISGNNASRVFRVESSGNLTLDGVTITNGNGMSGTTNTFLNGFGGGNF
jgi:hypothetical protein